MASPINSHTNNSPPLTGGAKGGSEKLSSAAGKSEQVSAVVDDQTSISEAAKQLNQADSVGSTSGLGREQAQQLASELRELFSQVPQQALAGQAGNIDNQVRELLKQSA